MNSLPSHLLVLVVVFMVACGGNTPQVTSPTMPEVPTVAVGPPPTAVYTVSGSVHASTFAATPLENARVQILDGPRAGAYALTDAAGAFRLSDVPAGKVKIRASKDGYQDDPEHSDDFLDWYYPISGDTTMSFSLYPLPRSISIGDVVSTVMGRSDAVCSDEATGDRYHCERFTVTTTARGALTVQLRWNAPQTKLLLVIDLWPHGFLNPMGPSPLTVSLPVEAGTRYPIAVWDFPGGTLDDTFELTAELHLR